MGKTMFKGFDGIILSHTERCAVAVSRLLTQPLLLVPLRAALRAAKARNVRVIIGQCQLHFGAEVPVSPGDRFTFLTGLELE